MLNVLSKTIQGTLTVIIRNDGPMVHCGDNPSYRTVRLQLTPEQTSLIELRHIGGAGDTAFHEEISRAILE